MYRFIFIFVAHSVFILCVLDIFFKSTVYTNLKPFNSSEVLQHLKELSVQQDFPLYQKKSISFKADRLVLFSCDGLPADYLYEVSTDGSSNTPFLRSIIEENGSWGLSYTRVPTESRPGHVAIIAGLYEDPSAIFWGWKDNPVTFDSVFNQSDATFSWGCEDILHLFKKRARSGHVFNYEYPSDWQDYSGKNGTAELLDTWVKNEFHKFISNAKHNTTLGRLIEKPKTIFFFHLLGMDVAGHSYKPKTEFYYNALQNADDIIQNITSTIKTFFEDDRTAFILTSDHGMTDWGSHGASSLIETVTPIVCWGYGIKTPVIINKITSVHEKSKLNGKFIVTPQNWNLSSLLRHDINQADLAVLMSTLLDIPIPVNSMGVLPLSILDIPAYDICIAYFLNALQLLQQFHSKENSTKEHLASIFFKPFQHLTNDVESHFIKKIELSILRNDLKNSIALTNLLIKKIMNGMEYYDSYFQEILLGHLLACFFAVGMVITGQILYHWNPRGLINAGIYKMEKKFRKSMYWSLFSMGFLVLIFSIFGDAVPLHYLFYFLLGLSLVMWSIMENEFYLSSFKILMNVKFILELIMYLFGIQLVVFSFFDRRVLSYGLWAISLWPLQEKSLSNLSIRDKIEWFIMCISLSVFPNLPIVEKKDNIILRIIATIYWIYTTHDTEQVYHIPRQSFKITSFLKISSCLIIINILGIYLYFSYGISCLTIHQFLSFSILFCLLITLKFGPTRILPRFACISVSVGLSFLLFTLSYDALFPIFLSRLLYIWINFEFEIHLEQLQRTYGYMHLRSFGCLVGHDVRRCFLFIFFVFISFFGVGNLSSINSFNTDWIKGFVTTFSPFLMMALIILRTIIPIFLVICAFKFVILSINVSPKPMFYIVLLFCDSVAAELLLSVNNVGSWLDIGTSLTRFILMEFIVLFLLIMYALVEFSTAGVKVGRENIPDILQFNNPNENYHGLNIMPQVDEFNEVDIIPPVQINHNSEFEDMQHF